VYVKSKPTKKFACQNLLPNVHLAGFHLQPMNQAREFKKIQDAAPDGA
jgi:hypothetical protein